VSQQLELFSALSMAIVLGAFVASFLNAAFAFGGAMIMLAVSASVLPVASIVPMHSALMLGSLVARIALFWRHIYWPIVIPFVTGCLIGTVLGARIYVELPEYLIAVTLGSLMLVSVWLPEVTWRPKFRHPWFPVGIVHSFLSTVFAYGALLHPLILRTKLSKLQIIATLAGSLFAMGILKMTGYSMFGFDYRPFLPLIVAATLAGFIGTWAGKLITHRISEQLFRLVFKILMTLVALRILFRGLTLILN